MPHAEPSSLTLFVPHLLWPEPGQDFVFADLDLPGLESLLAQATPDRQASAASETVLMAQFPGTDKSAAALRHGGENLDADDNTLLAANWLCADPAHLRLQQEHIVLADADYLEPDTAEATAVIADLNRTFADLGEFSAPHPQRWYLRLHQTLPQSLTSLPPPSAAVGRTLAASLPADAGSAPLRQLLNELQMFLHAHPINVARAAAGRPAINALWLWGNTMLPTAAAATGFTCVHTDDALSRGLARHAGIASQPLAPGLPALPMRASGADFIHLAALQSPALGENSEAWRQALLRLESDWFAPLAEALATGRRASATLIAPCAHGVWRWKIQAPAFWRRWLPARLRRPPSRPFADWTKDLA